MSNTDEEVAGHRFKRRWFSGLGWNWLAGREVGVVLRGENFHRLERGGRELWLVPGLERIVFKLDTLPDNMQWVSENIQTLDGIMLSVGWKLEFMLDPFSVPVSDHAKVAKRCRYPEERRVIVRDQAHRALQEVVSRFNVVEMARGGVTWRRVEDLFFEALQTLLKPFALVLIKERSSIQDVVLPEAIARRIETATERIISAQALAQLTPEEQAQVLRAEAIEALKQMTGGSPYLNLHDLAAGNDTGSASANANALPKPSQQVIDNPPQKRDDEDKSDSSSSSSNDPDRFTFIE